MNEYQANALETRRRLRNPPGGILSSELEVISEPEARRRRIADFERVLELERQARERRAATMVDDYARQLQAWVIDGVVAEPRESPLLRLTFGHIVAAVCEHKKVKRIDIMAQRRTAGPVRARHIAMYLAREHTIMSLPEIGRRLGGRDHTTCLHGWRKIACLLAEGDAELAADVAAIRTKLGIAVE